MAEKLMKYADSTKKYDVVFGLETHVELSTNTKLFCPAHIECGGEPNTELTPVSLGLPGSLPVINKTAVDYAIKLGISLLFFLPLYGLLLAWLTRRLVVWTGQADAAPRTA